MTDIDRYPLPHGVNDQVLNKNQLARALAVTEPTIDRWMRDGMPILSEGTNGRSYEFQLSACWAWRQARETERAAQLDAAERAVQEMRLALVGGKTGDSERALPPKERQALYAAEREWMAMARDRGELIPFADVTMILDKTLAQVRAAIDAMPDRLGRELGLSFAQVQAAIVIGDDILTDMQKGLSRFVAEHRAAEHEANAPR